MCYGILISDRKVRGNLRANLVKRKRTIGEEIPVMSLTEIFVRPIRAGECSPCATFPLYMNSIYSMGINYLLNILVWEVPSMASSDKHKDPSRHRSYKGCWTCKRKRIQCDEVRPACGKCTLRGISCGGYEIRLRWGAGIASRGKYSGAEKPVQECIPPQSRRRWDMRGKTEQSDKGKNQPSPPLEGMTASAVHVQFSHGSIDQPELVAQRATVNILNTPWELDSSGQTDAINKHFEIPVSSAPLTEAKVHVCSGSGTANQYSRSLSGSIQT